MPGDRRVGRPHVVIVGAGFGGLRAATRLAGKAADVTIVDEHNYHTFLPLLYQIATAGLEGGQIAYPIRAIFSRARNVHFRLARAEGVDLAQQRLLTSLGPLDYDYLILAAGSTTNFFGMPDVQERAYGLKDITEASALRNHVLTMFERAVAEPDPQQRAALLTFVIVGGGPTGVELAGAFSELMAHVLINDYPSLDFKQVRVILLEATDKLLAAFPARLQAYAVKTLRDKAIDVRLNAAVSDAAEGEVRLKDGTIIRTHTLVWAAGVRAVDLAQALGQPTAKGGRVRVEPTLQLPAARNVFVIGDMAYLEENGQALPMLAPVAMQQGEHAADNVLRLIRGAPLQPFHYLDKGTMATIGRNQAVAVIGRLRFTGFAAWLVWLTVHIVQLIGFRNRIIVLVNWAWDYLLYERESRLITTESVMKDEAVPAEDAAARHSVSQW